ncbi:MAG: hypothetical protein ACR2NP_06150 [Pirellulaceae bacterium]
MAGWLKSLFGGGTSISVSIPCEESFPNEKELGHRNAIMDELDGMKFGKFIGAGGGFSQMDFQYKVRNAREAEHIVREVVTRHLGGDTMFKVTVG